MSEQHQAHCFCRRCTTELAEWMEQQRFEAELDRQILIAETVPCTDEEWQRRLDGLVPLIRRIPVPLEDIR